MKNGSIVSTGTNGSFSIVSEIVDKSVYTETLFFVGAFLENFKWFSYYVLRVPDFRKK